jgi:hypothetical protein
VKIGAANAKATAVPLVQNRDWRIELIFIQQIPRRAILKYEGWRPQGKSRWTGGARPSFEGYAERISIAHNREVLSETHAGMEE